MEKTYHLGVKALIQNESGDILLLKGCPRQFANAHWDIPGGRVHEGELPEETLCREVQEEIGVRPQLIDHFDFALSSIEILLPEGKKAGLILMIYSCVLSGNELLVLSKEHSEYAWTQPDTAAILLAYKYPKSFTEKIEKLTSHRLQNVS